MQIIKTVVRFLIIVAPLSVTAQSTFLQQGAKDYILLDRLEIKLQKDSLLNFSFIKPFPRKWWVNTLENVKADVNSNLSRVDEHNLQSALMNNSEWVTGSKESFRSKKSLWNTFYKTQSNFLEVDQEDFFLSVNPVLNLQAMKENNNGEFLYLNTGGLVARGLIAKKLGFQTYLSENQERGPLFLQNRISEFRAVPGAGFYKPFKRTGVDYFDARGYITFNAAKFINFQFGYDRNFIGNGYRSLFLSDYSNNMLFLKINTRVWRLNYNFMVMELTPQYKRGATDSLLSKKYAAIHHISFNAPKWLTFGVFEGIAFGRKDRFDFLYLNPVIFLRPVEQQAGSPDNALIGFDIKANVARRFQFYTQVMLDEFKLSEIRNGTGWWANKWALQLGGKYIDAFGLKNLDLHAEANWVRPFTYSHTDTVANYTHYNQPLAHPLGADFRELVLIARYQPAPKWYIQGRIISYLQGVGTGGANLGNSIFLPNTTRPFNYGYKIVTGNEAKVVNANLYLAYEWKENFFIEANLLMRKITGSANSTTASLGIRWNMHRREYDY